MKEKMQEMENEQATLKSEKMQLEMKLKKEIFSKELLEKEIEKKRFKDKMLEGEMKMKIKQLQINFREQ